MQSIRNPAPGHGAHDYNIRMPNPKALRDRGIDTTIPTEEIPQHFTVLSQRGDLMEERSVLGHELIDARRLLINARRLLIDATAQLHADLIDARHHLNTRLVDTTALIYQMLVNRLEARRKIRQAGFHHIQSHHDL